MRVTFYLKVWLIAVLFPALPFAQPGTDPFPPGPVPDRIILTWSGDPATTQSVSWRTDSSVVEAVAEVALATPSPKFRESTRIIKASSERFIHGDNSATLHSATFTHLIPNTLYAYRVGDGDCWSEWFHFRTASRKKEPFSFLYFGDAQNEIKSMWSRCIRQAYATMPDADFMVHAGDLVNSPESDQEWGEWFHAGGWIFGMIPSLPTPGNHEYIRDEDRVRHLSKFWRPTFTLPENGPKGLEETVYYIDYQGARIISLNTQAVISYPGTREAQKEWLEEVLRNNPQRWTIVTHHHPVYSASMGRDNEEVRSLFQPLYEKYGVDIVLQGHDHTYARGRNLDFGRNVKGDGPVYVVSVSGPKMYLLNFEDWEERVASNTQLYQVIKVENKRLRYEAYTATGELYDVFELRKNQKGINRFVEMANGEIPEIISPGDKLMTEDELKIYQERFEKYREKKNKG